MKKNTLGFTLIELMVTIAIIAILATVGAATYSQSQKVARDGKRIGELGEIQNAIEQYYALNQKYPGSNGDTGVYPAVLNTYFTNGVTPDDGTGSATLSPYRYFPCPTQDRYLLCKGLESCGSSKCTETTYPVNGCSTPGTAGPTKVIACVSNISTN